MRPPSVQEGLGNWIALLKQWRVGLAVAASGFAASCVVLMVLTPVYKADVQLLLPAASLEDPAGRKAGNMQADPYVVRSYSDVIVNDTISKRVIDEMHLRDNEEFAEKPNFLSQIVGDLGNLLNAREDDETARRFSKEELREANLLGEYESRLKATNDGRSLTLVLSFKAHDPRLAQAIVNAQARAFVENEIARHRAAAAAKTEWMKQQLDRTQAEFLKSQEALQAGPPGSSVLMDHTGAGISALRMRESLAKTTVDVYGSVLKHYQDMLADESYGGSDIKIVSLATLPTHPFFPKKVLFAAVAALVWSILGIGAAALAAVVRDRVSIEAWLRASGRKTLGYVHFPKWRTRGWTRRVDLARKRVFWEQVREVQSAIRRTTRRRPVVLITSALPAEGKSLLASALAHGLAASGVKTLLVDINARNARYAKAIDPEARSSESDDLADERMPTAHAAVRVAADIPLYYIGNRSSEGGTLPLASATKLRSAFAALKKRFDVIIIDAPAMESLSDALQLVEVADDVILTSLVDQDPDELQRCLGKLEDRSAKIRGVVITEKRSVPADLCSKVMSYSSDKSPSEIWPVGANRRHVAARLGRWLLSARKNENDLNPQAKLG